MQRIAVFLALIVAAAANGAVIIGPEQPVSSAGALGVPAAGEFRLTVASDGETAMLVWMSYNHGVTQVAGRRVTANGDPIGDAPILFSGVGNYNAAAIAWTGSRYILAWWRDDAIEARTVERDGALGPLNTIGQEPGQWGVKLSMSCASGRCILAWSRPDYPTEANFVRAAMIGNDALLVSDPIRVSDDPMGSEIATSAANGAFLLVENSTEPNFHKAPQLLSGVILDRTGTIVHRIAVPPDGTQTLNLSATHTGDGFVVAFDFVGSNLLRIGFDGSTGSIQPIKNATWLRLADGVWNGYLVGTMDTRTVLLDLNGNVIRSGSAASAIVLVGNDAALSISGLSVQRINVDLIASNPILLTVAPTDQYLPAIAAASQNEAMLMWAEPERILVTRLQDGVPQGDAVTLSANPFHGNVNLPISIASSGRSYLAVWMDDYDHGPSGQLFTASGSRRLQLPGHTSLAVGWDEDNYVVAYTTGAYISNQSVPRPEITRIDDAGNVLSTGDAGGPRSGSEMSIQCGPQACINTSFDEVALVTKYASVPLGSAPRQTDRDVSTVDAAPAGFGFIVAENTPSGLLWFHVNPNGTKSAVHDPLPSDPLGGVAATRLGNEVLIAWTSPAPRHLLGIVVDEAGTITTGPFAMTSSNDEESLPAFANGRLAYVRSTDRYGVPRMGRVMTRSISMSRHRAATH